MAEPFPANSRLRHRGEFTAVQTGGRRVAARFVTLLATPNALGHDRLGIIASRRLGGAVMRNRAKRRVRELFRHRPIDATMASLDIVAIPRREAVEAPFVMLEHDFQSALRKLRSRR